MDRATWLHVGLTPHEALSISGYPFLFMFVPVETIKILRIYGQVVTFIFGPLTILSAIAFDAKAVK